MSDPWRENETVLSAVIGGEDFGYNDKSNSSIDYIICDDDGVNNDNNGYENRRNDTGGSGDRGCGDTGHGGAHLAQNSNQQNYFTNPIFELIPKKQTHQTESEFLKDFIKQIPELFQNATLAQKFVLLKYIMEIYERLLNEEQAKMASSSVKRNKPRSKKRLKTNVGGDGDHSLPEDNDATVRSALIPGDVTDEDLLILPSTTVNDSAEDTLNFVEKFLNDYATVQLLEGGIGGEAPSMEDLHLGEELFTTEEPMEGLNLAKEPTNTPQPKEPMHRSMSNLMEVAKEDDSLLELLKESRVERSKRTKRRSAALPSQALEHPANAVQPVQAAAQPAQAAAQPVQVAAPQPPESPLQRRPRPRPLTEEEYMLRLPIRNRKILPISALPKVPFNINLSAISYFPMDFSLERGQFEYERHKRDFSMDNVNSTARSSPQRSQPQSQPQSEPPQSQPMTSTADPLSLLDVRQAISDIEAAGSEVAPFPQAQESQNLQQQNLSTIGEDIGLSAQSAGQSLLQFGNGGYHHQAPDSIETARHLVGSLQREDAYLMPPPTSLAGLQRQNPTVTGPRIITPDSGFQPTPLSQDRLQSRQTIASSTPLRRPSNVAFGGEGSAFSLPPPSYMPDIPEDLAEVLPPLPFELPEEEHAHTVARRTAEAPQAPAEIVEEASAMDIVPDPAAIQAADPAAIQAVDPAAEDVGWFRDWFGILRERQVDVNYANAAANLRRRHKSRRNRRNPAAPPRRLVNEQEPADAASPQPQPPGAAALQTFLHKIMPHKVPPSPATAAAVATAPPPPPPTDFNFDDFGDLEGATAQPSLSQNERQNPPMDDDTSVGPQSQHRQLRKRPTWLERHMPDTDSAQDQQQNMYDRFILEHTKEISTIWENFDTCCTMFNNHIRRLATGDVPQNIRYYDPEMLFNVPIERIAVKLNIIQELIRRDSFDFTKLTAVRDRMTAAIAFGFVLDLKAAGLINLNADGRTVSLVMF